MLLGGNTGAQSSRQVVLCGEARAGKLLQLLSPRFMWLFLLAEHVAGFQKPGFVEIAAFRV